MVSRSPRFHLWCPNLFNFKGGIQVYSAYFLQALQDLYPQASYDIFLMHDIDTSPHVPYLPGTQFHFAGQYPSSIRNPVFAAQLIGQTIRHRPDLIITTHLNFTPVAHWLKRLLGIPFWTIAHGVEAWDIQRSAIKNALHSAECILAVSQYTRNRLLDEQKLDPTQISLLPNTVDTTRFQIAAKPNHLLQKYGLTPEQPIILTVSRLCSTESYRGYDKVLEALPMIRQFIPNVHYLIVGKGDDQARLERYIAQLNLQDSVTLAGFVPDKELCDYYNVCNVFAMPSKLEGFGIVYLEALACGRPVLGGNQDGAIDALCQGDLGVLVNPDDAEEIAKNLIQILQGQHLNRTLYQPEILRQRMIEHYGFSQFRDNLTKHLNDFFTVSNSLLSSNP
ncbi:glycosyltransferase [Leptolyngbya sp. NK1-12]|uniref:Glycosyltransferase n=1 Tax=Leptolyngbya sp. NK1-12 TaxID=2547451 RepID=A0AA97AJ22_9CYAN|nr:glycosyltransferase [Leptolyngbya sp. NK1-12]